MPWLKVDLNIKIRFKQQKDVSTVMNNSKNRKRKIVWSDPPCFKKYQYKIIQPTG